MAGNAQEWNAYNLMQQIERDLGDTVGIEEPVAWGTEDLTPSNTVFGVDTPEAWQSPWSRRVPRFDDVERPQHYNSGKVEAIEAIKASMSHEEYLGYLKGNTIKYLWRYRYKGKPLQDLNKAQWYLNKLKEEHK